MSRISFARTGAKPTEMSSDGPSPIAGVTFDQEMLTLEVQSWAPDQCDVEIHLEPSLRDGEPTVTVVSIDPARQRIERCFPAHHLRVERPGGRPTP